MADVILEPGKTDLTALQAIYRDPGLAVSLSRRTRDEVEATAAIIAAAAAGEAPVYGVNTGFGKLAGVKISPADTAALQRNLILSHCCGVGAPTPPPIVALMMALKLVSLGRGASGVRWELIELLEAMLAGGVRPLVPLQGSVGASGDLAPLAHLAAVLIGEGEALLIADGQEKAMPAIAVLQKAGLAPLAFGPKEGLALINGTQVMSAIGTLALLKAERLCTAGDVIGAMSLEALMGSHRAFDRKIHAARPQPGQGVSAANLRKLLRESKIEKSHADCGRVQDCYSLRCIPQVHGAVRDALRYVRSVLECEINSSTDNPMVFADAGRLISGGNFHGQPVSVALDHLATATCSLATISERRIERLLNPDLSRLPAFLAHDPGLHSGLMIAHVTAAALVSENKVLAHPASVDSIPTSAAKEDHVSMGAHAARKAARIVDHAGTVLGIEALCAGQALDLHRPLKAARAVESVRAALRRVIPHMKRDRVLATDIEKSKRWIESGKLRAAAEKVCGPLD